MWYRIPAYEALWPLLDQINAEMDAKMEQVHPGIISGKQCAKCLSFQADYERAVIDNEVLEGVCKQLRDERDKAHKTIEQHEQTIAEIQQQLRHQDNENLRMDRGIYSPDGFNTGSGD